VFQYHPSTLFHDSIRSLTFFYTTSPQASTDSWPCTGHSRATHECILKLSQRQLSFSSSLLINSWSPSSTTIYIKRLLTPCTIQDEVQDINSEWSNISTTTSRASELTLQVSETFLIPSALYPFLTKQLFFTEPQNSLTEPRRPFLFLLLFY
jgi:hypothetical protein